MMKKPRIFLIFSIFLLIISGLIPYITGIKAEEQFTLISMQLPDNLKIVNSNYQRGWLNSTAESTLLLREANDTVQTITLTHQIEHGFLPLKPAVIYTYIQADLSNNTPPNQLTGQASPFFIRTELQANGDVNNTLNMERLRLQQADNAMQWQGLTGEVNLSQTGHLASTTLKLPALHSQSKLGELTIQDLQLQATVEESIAHLLLGHGHLQIGTLTLTNPFIGKIQLSELTINSYNVPNDTYLNLQFLITSKQLQLNTHNYQNVKIVLDLNQIHKESLQNIIVQLNQLQNLQFTSPTQLNFWLLGIMMRDGIPLLKHNPTVNISELSALTDAGTVNAQLKVHIDNLPSVSIFTLNTLPTNFIYEFSLEAPKPFLNKLIQTITYYWLTPEAVSATIIEARLQHWEKQGLLIATQTNQQYKTEITWKNNRLNVNGQNIPTQRVETIEKNY
ncbi:hypothetical protein BegalDRAFT_0108 [Beggiatoa alba B18LD]|uniref:DUF945 family protein n=1 Tax=Beggiatoa alba B18LD TaxID=395493 RepID=I3CBN9_9GAMM|nr:DUF945 family protein [Beggiatoa alba]EIJ41032.1 hypothetical protein BegalDRAFT_0108 [Beggiatoa alba B18LD]